MSVADFDQSGFGGYTQQEAQTHRVRDSIARAIAETFCSTEFSKHIESYELRKTVAKMIDVGGYKLHIIHVGYDK